MRGRDPDRAPGRPRGRSDIRGSQITRACTDMRNQHAHKNSVCGQLDTREGFEVFEVKQISPEENFTRGLENRFVLTKKESPSGENLQFAK